MITNLNVSLEDFKQNLSAGNIGNSVFYFVFFRDLNLLLMRASTGMFVRPSQKLELL